MGDRLTRVLVIALLAVLGFYFAQPYLDRVLYSASTPRVVAPRGSLADIERTTIELFEKIEKLSGVHLNPAKGGGPLERATCSAFAKGTGSGFIWDEAGHVVTNYHVLENASEATVKLADGRDYKASLVGASKAHDLAVLSIGVNFNAPPPVPIGASHELRVGQKVYAIGNPFGLDCSFRPASSARLAVLPTQGGFVIENMIQTDAPSIRAIPAVRCSTRPRE